MRVLVVDDDVQIRRALRINLEARGYEVFEAPTGPEGVAHAVTKSPDLVILDLGLPGLGGVAVVTAIRDRTAAPILVLSGRTESGEKVGALDAGANDYVTKPFAIDELLARVRALTRDSAPAEVVEFGDIRMDFARHELSRAGTPVKLTPTEWSVLEVLVRNPDRLVGKRELLTTVWGPTYVREDGYLRLYLGQLRKKLERDPARPKHLLTEPGLGYRFVP